MKTKALFNHTYDTKKTRAIVSITCLMTICGTLLAAQACGSSHRDKKGSDKKKAGLEIPVYTTPRAEQRIEHLGYTVSYNPDWRLPNWVAYELTADEVLGTYPRAQNFEIDPEVTGVCADPRDYSRSSYDRGHMAPAGDMKWSWQAMQESFYMTNICPQDRNLNSGDWNTLEERARGWATAFEKLYIVCGPIVPDTPQTIGYNKVAVPDAFFKVLLCQNNGKWQAIGFLYDNVAGHRPMSQYCKTIDEIEALTGIDFFPALPDKVENTVEAAYDLSAWRIKGN